MVTATFTLCILRSFSPYCHNGESRHSGIFLMCLCIFPQKMLFVFY